MHHTIFMFPADVQYFINEENFFVTFQALIYRHIWQDFTSVQVSLMA